MLLALSHIRGARVAHRVVTATTARPAVALARRCLATETARLRPLASSLHGPVSVPGFTVTSPHARLTTQTAEDYMLIHSTYSKEEVEALKTDIHYEPANMRDRVALAAITVVRKAFDLVSGYSATPGKMSEVSGVASVRARHVCARTARARTARALRVRAHRALRAHTWLLFSPPHVPSFLL